MLDFERARLHQQRRPSCRPAGCQDPSQSRDAKLALCSLSEQIREVFEISGFDKIISIYSVSGRGPGLPGRADPVKRRPMAAMAGLNRRHPFERSPTQAKRRTGGSRASPGTILMALTPVASRVWRDGIASSEVLREDSRSRGIPIVPVMAGTGLPAGLEHHGPAGSDGGSPPADSGPERGRYLLGARRRRRRRARQRRRRRFPGRRTLLHRPPAGPPAAGHLPSAVRHSGPASSSRTRAWASRSPAIDSTATSKSRRPRPSPVPSIRRVALGRLRNLADSIRLVRDLINTPAQDMMPGGSGP